MEYNTQTTLSTETYSYIYVIEKEDGDLYVYLVSSSEMYQLYQYISAGKNSGLLMTNKGFVVISKNFDISKNKSKIEKIMESRDNLFEVQNVISNK